jgi:hypothetical protein
LLSLSSIAAAYTNYSSVDMIRAQLALMEDRPKDCPPWYAITLVPHVSLGMLMVLLAASTATSPSTRAANLRHVANTAANATALRALAATIV